MNGHGIRAEEFTEDGRTLVRVTLDGTPVEVDSSSVLRHAAEVTFVDVGDDVVVYLPSRNRSFVLEPLSGALWHCLDGRATIEDILDDAAAVLDADLASATERFLPLFEQWAAEEIVEVAS